MSLSHIHFNLVCSRLASRFPTHVCANAALPLSFRCSAATAASVHYVCSPRGHLVCFVPVCYFWIKTCLPSKQKKARVTDGCRCMPAQPTKTSSCRCSRRRSEHLAGAVTLCGDLNCLQSDSGCAQGSRRTGVPVGVCVCRQGVDSRHCGVQCWLQRLADVPVCGGKYKLNCCRLSSCVPGLSALLHRNAF